MTIKNKVLAGFNRGAKTYDQAARLQAKIADRLAAKLTGISAQQILEVGCGTGLLSQHLVTQFPQADLLLTDISPAMIEKCRLRLADLPNIKLACVDGEVLIDLPTFDLITSSMTLHWFKELESSLRYMQQKLRKGGRLVFAMLTENSLPEWRNICHQFAYPVSTPPFPAMTALRENFAELKFTIETIKEVYSNAHDFLNTLKLLGAVAPRAGYVPLTPGKMRTILRHFNSEIEITYEVVYGEYCYL